MIFVILGRKPKDIISRNVFDCRDVNSLTGDDS